MDDQIQGRKIFALGPSPVDLSEPSFESHPSHCTSNLAAHGHAEAGVLESVFNEKKR